MFEIVRHVEEWPAHLGHYRFVRMREPASGGGGIVEMSANRPFGPLNWPTWWLSEMRLDEQAPAIHFRHVAGITRGMDVVWAFAPVTDGTRVRITHSWSGPPWPLMGGFAWRHVIGPHFVSFIATRTLLGVSREAERRHRQGQT